MEWGSDALSRFVKQTHVMAYDAFVDRPSAYSTLASIDAGFRLLDEGKVKPPGMDETPAILIVHAHSMYLAAVNCALSGHAAATYPLLRTSLETALYVLFMVSDPKKIGVWLARGESDQARSICREEFTLGKVVRAAKSINPELGAEIDERYNKLIDMGAHPNWPGLENQVRRTPEEFQVAILLRTTPDRLVSLIACMDIGMIVLRIIVLALPPYSQQAALEPVAKNLWETRQAAVDAMVRESNTLYQAAESKAKEQRTGSKQ